MKRLLEDFDRLFDLRHEVRGVPLMQLIEQAIIEIDADALPEWGTVGKADRAGEEQLGAVRFRYTPHLFPDMDLKLRLAHMLQFHLLPRDPRPGGAVSVSAVLESYCHLSGDLFGWESLEDGRFLLWIVDMSGHGVRSGLASAILKVLIANTEDRGDLSGLVAGLNESLCACVRRDNTPVFATGFFATISEDGVVDHVSAGHPPVLARGPDGNVRELQSNCIPVGLFEGTPYRVERARVRPGELLLLATDGLFEMTDERGEPFGAERLRRFLASRDFRRTTELTDALYRRCHSFRDTSKLEDDLSFVSARLRGTAR